MNTLIIIILVIIILGGLPNFGYAHSYGYYPSGITFVLLVIFVLFLLGRL